MGTKKVVGKKKVDSVHTDSLPDLQDKCRARDLPFNDASDAEELRERLKGAAKVEAAD